MLIFSIPHSVPVHRPISRPSSAKLKIVVGCCGVASLSLVLSLPEHPRVNNNSVNAFIYTYGYIRFVLRSARCRTDTCRTSAERIGPAQYPTGIVRTTIYSTLGYIAPAWSRYPARTALHNTVTAAENQLAQIARIIANGQSKAESCSAISNFSRAALRHMYVCRGELRSCVRERRGARV